MRIKTHIKTGAMSANHSQSVACGLRVKTSVKAGPILRVRTVGG